MLCVDFARRKSQARDVETVNTTESLWAEMRYLPTEAMRSIWKTKHMIGLAKFQTEVKTFAGLLIPYGKGKAGILGGGDIGFTLMFSGVILKNFGFLEAIITSLAITAALAALFVMS